MGQGPFLGGGPFLEIITRCYKRPAMLRANQDALQLQTDGDWVQSLLIDDVGRGIKWSHENMGRYAPHLRGRYIWILDDDDICTCPTLVADLKRIVRACRPDVIMVKMDHGPEHEGGAILPAPPLWGSGDLVYGRIGCSAYIVRRELWQEHAGALTPGWYGSDYSLINAILGNSPLFNLAMWQREPLIYWHDCIASKVQRHSLGKREDETEREQSNHDRQEIFESGGDPGARRPDHRGRTDPGMGRGLG